MWHLCELHRLHHSLSNLSHTPTHTHRQCNGYKETCLRVTSEGTSREVTHYHFTAWPDFGNPRTPAGFVEMVQRVRGGREGDGGPILVHCSAGLGRSGVFVAVHSSLDTLERGEGRVDMETTVREMRKKRGGMVQTQDQFRFCLEAVAEALDPIHPPGDEEGFRPPEGTQISESDPSLAAAVGDAPPLPPRQPSQRLRDTTHTATPRKTSPLDDTEEERMKRVSSPPPPSSSPPPPLTPPTSESTEDTPTKFPFPETSPEATPTKSPAHNLPDILVTPPTRNSSTFGINRDAGSIDYKQVSKETDARRNTKKKGAAITSTQQQATPPDRPPAVGKPNVKSKVKPEQESPQPRPQETSKTPSPPIQPQVGEREAASLPGVTEVELEQTLTRFEVPPPGIEEVAEGFTIGDDEAMEAWLPPKMEVMKKPKETKKRWGGGGTLSEKPLATSSTGGTKPRKWAPVSTSHSQTSKPEPVNQNGSDGDDGRRERVQRVGKLVIPGIFGPPSPPSPTTTPRKPVTQDPKLVKPVSEPAKPAETKPPVSEPAKPVKPVSGPAKRVTTTPPVLRMIRKIEGEKEVARNTRLPSPSTIEQKPVKPVVQEKPIKPVEHEKTVEQESPPPNVRSLLARFEQKT